MIIGESCKSSFFNLENAAPFSKSSRALGYRDSARLGLDCKQTTLQFKGISVRAACNRRHTQLLGEPPAIA